MKTEELVKHCKDRMKSIKDKIETKRKSKKVYSEEEAYTIWQAGQEYWKTSGASITFEELTEQFKKK